MAMENPLFITVFIPVYNGEKYLQETLLSVQKQSYIHFEVLMVDDSSSDASLEILKNFAKNDTRFKIFTKKNGGMVAHSMNFILPEVRGDYFFYASQDDLFSEDLFEKMVQRQRETQAHSILPDMEFYYEKSKNSKNSKQIIGLNGNRNIELSGKLACEKSLDWSIHGFALFKSTLVKAEFFPEDAFDSDEYVTRKLFLNSNKVVFSEGVFYYRQDNSSAITKTFGKKNFYVLNTSWKLYELVKRNNFNEGVVFKRQLGIMQQYLDLFSTFKSFEFELESDKREINTFLIDFKNSYLLHSFYFYNFKYAVLNLKWKYMLWIVVLRTPILFRFLVSYRTILKKKSLK